MTCGNVRDSSQKEIIKADIHLFYLSRVWQGNESSRLFNVRYMPRRAGELLFYSLRVIDSEQTLSIR